MNVLVRFGQKEDIPAALKLISELAEFEKAPNEVEVSLQEMIDWGFGENPLFRFFVAEIDGEVIGLALYYYKYSTWKGKSIFLEDIIVTEKMRNKRIGSSLFNEVVKVAKKENVKRMEWQVLKWNASAIDFYKKYGSNLDEDWVNCKLTYEQIQSL